MGRTALTTEIFKERSIKAHGNVYDYTNSVYINALTKVKIGCKKHGYFLQEPHKHMKGNGCIKCGWEQSGITQTTEFALSIKDRGVKIHGNKYDYSKVEYKNMFEKVILFCPIHGEFEQTPNEHLKGNGCYRCNKSFPLTREIFIDKATKIHGNKYNYNLVEYKNNLTKVKITCHKHGVFEQTPGSHLFGRGCGKCNNSVSKPETLWLNSLNIPEEYRNKVIRINGKIFKVDAYNPITNTIYEFYGDFWHGNPKVFDLDEINRANHKSYGKLYSKTIERENKIKKDGYNLIIIWENDWKQSLINK